MDEYSKLQWWERFHSNALNDARKRRSNYSVEQLSTRFDNENT